MTTKVRKWGNSLAVRIPQKIAKKFFLKEGSDVVIRENDTAIIIKQTNPTGKTARKDQWKTYVIPTHRKKENISGNIDGILYDKSR